MKLLKRSSLLILAVFCLLLSSCSSANDYNITFTANDSTKMYVIGYDEVYTVYAIGGLPFTEFEGQTMLLEQAFYDGKFTVTEFIESVRRDAEDGDVEYTDRLNGNMEYHYEDFNLVFKNDSGVYGIYFLPTTMDFYSVNV